MNINKYFWDLKDNAVRETKRILKNPAHPKFITRIVNLLSRCDKPKELFSIISKKKFINVWPKIRSYWFKTTRNSDFRDWWETIYEQLLEEYVSEQKKPKGKPYPLFLKIGRGIKEIRMQKGLSQKELAIRVGIKQPDVSNIEEGRKNITLLTLLKFCKVLEIKRIDFT